MKWNLPVVIVIVFALAFLSFRHADTILQKLGIVQTEAYYSIERNILFDNIFSLPKAALLQSAIQGDKQELARELCAYVRQYAESKDFAAAYAREREAKKPNSEPAKTMDAATLKQMEDLAKMYEEWATNKSYDEKTRATFKSDAAKISQQVAVEKDPHPNKTKWEKEYPANPSAQIRKKLMEALQIMESVDFNAPTITNNYGKQIFTNPEYEKKSKKWKACYRAGKEVNMVVKDFINQWLKEGIKTDQAGQMIQQTKVMHASTAVNNPAPAKEETPVQADNKKKPGLKSLKGKVLEKIGTQ